VTESRRSKSQILLLLSIEKVVQHLFVTYAFAVDRASRTDPASNTATGSDRGENHRGPAPKRPRHYEIGREADHHQRIAAAFAELANSI